MSATDPPVPDPEIPWVLDTAPGRMAPRMCIRNAREDMDKAWQTTDPARAILLIRSAVDWQRRALEQMAEAIERQSDG